MQDYLITADKIAGYESYLQDEERAGGTVEKYLRDVRKFAKWLNGRPVTKDVVVEWKEKLVEEH